MKKIFFALVTLLAFASCVQEDLPVVNNPADGEGGYVTLNFSVVLPDMQEATRTMASPAISSLHLLVFDDNGMLSEAVPASPVTSWGVSSETPTEFTATLMRTDYKRTIHFVANSPIAIADYPMSTEGQILTTMTVSGTQDAYWQRVVLPNGITGTQGKDADGDVIYVPTDDVKAALTNVPLVRNYSRVKVVNAISEDKKPLANLEFVLVNIPTSGTVVPFNTNSGEFVDFGSTTTYASLLSDNYLGYEPANRTLCNNTFTGGALNCENGTDWVAATAADADSGYQYLYERYQKVEPAYVIVRGVYDDDSVATYYKIDIINDKGESYNLLRNIEYTVNITNVLGSGFATAEEAYNAGPTNNLNFSVETKNLLNLSDGTSALYVEYTQKVINQTGALVTLRYKYITDLANGTVGTDNVTITKGDGEVIDGAISEGDDTTDGEGWNTMSFTAGTIPAEGESAKTQIVTLTAGSFARNVEFILTRPYKLGLDVTDKVGKDLGSAVTATLTLEERLPFGIFPLEFIIVVENNTLSPDATRNTLPVVTGLNADGTPGGQHFGYKFTLEYDDYYKLVGGVDTYTTSFELYFKTNTADAAPDGAVCTAYNPYHNKATDDLYTGDLLYMTLSPKSLTLDYGVDKQFDVTLRLPDGLDDSLWTNGQYIDFEITDSNSTLELMTTSGDAQKISNDGKTYLRVLKSSYDNGIRGFVMYFKTLNKVSATTIYAESDGFRTATSVVLNNTYGRLAMSLDTTTALTPGAGQTVDVTVSVPAGVENAFENDQLELLLTTSAAYLDTPVTRAVSISKVSDTQFKVVLPKSDYDNANGTDIALRFTTTTGNTAGTRTITVSQDYLTSASVSTSTRKYGSSLKFVSSNTSTTEITRFNNSTTVYLLVELDSVVSVETPVSLTVSNLTRTNLVYSGESLSNGTYQVAVPANSKYCYVPLTVSMSNTSYYNSATFTITASGDAVETSTITMKGGRTNTGSNRNPVYTYHYSKQ